MKPVLTRLLNALYPRDAVCFACDRESYVNEHGLCEACAKQIHMAGELPCPHGIVGTYAAFWYEEPLHAAVYRFKYGGSKYLAWHFAACMSLPESFHADAIVPVPLFEDRQRKRGYNQSELVARMLGERYGLPVETALLTRTRNTSPQAGLSAQLREHNVDGAFKAAPGCKGRALLLVDDVMTTGSTLRSCAEALTDAGATIVYAACACAAPTGRMDPA